MPDPRTLALARANQIRSERKKVKDKLARRELLLDDVLGWSEPPPALANMRVVELIASAHMFGPTKARAALRRLGHPEHRRLYALTPRQRKDLIAFLAKHNRRALYGAAYRDYIC